ncbi:chemotaxis regulator - transmits chemoreceptor signals to flagelllar motor components CheY [Lachnospiraceae bacterium KM106-2]|nr:chemotaxis regulator - transmits chemoreceptor signals to flagelllar motor components CheY [Lachnospiraceae bacterium KM106-2]
MYQILIVDDDCLMRQALRVMIDRLDGFCVAAEAESGIEAVTICNQTKIDLIFMDIMMPGISGVEASYRIKERHKEITIYLLSAYTNFNLAKEALKSNIKEYLSKPISLGLLSDVLMNYRTEKEGSAQYQLKQLMDIIKEKEFKRVYYDLGTIIDEIYEHVGEIPEKLVEVFTYIGQSIINSVHYIDGESKKLDELFPINEALILERKVSELWLFKVMNYVFEQNSIRRYPLLESAFHFIEDNIKEDIGLNQVIYNCSISQGYLSRIFKDQFHTSVMDYIHIRKLNLAKGYFFFTDESIAEIAFKLGYNESSYFSKVFKKYEKMTVNQYKSTMYHHTSHK